MERLCLMRTQLLFEEIKILEMNSRDGHPTAHMPWKRPHEGVRMGHCMLYAFCLSIDIEKFIISLVSGRRECVPSQDSYWTSHMTSVSQNSVGEIHSCMYFYFLALTKAKLCVDLQALHFWTTLLCVPHILLSLKMLK